MAAQRLNTNEEKALKVDKATISRFWSKVDIRGPNECWPWKAGCFCRRNGKKSYGAFHRSNPKRLVKAHRFALEITKGKLKPHQRACHKCDNEPCCNPRHLWKGTVLSNVKDRNKKGRTARGEQSGMAKLTDREIRKIRLDGRQHRSIAKDYNVCKSTISYIKNGRLWSHVS